MLPMAHLPMTFTLSFSETARVFVQPRPVLQPGLRFLFQMLSSLRREWYCRRPLTAPRSITRVRCKWLSLWKGAQLFGIATIRTGNTITLNADWSVATANGHGIVQAGDFGAKANGLKAWLPTYAGIVAGGGSVANTFLTVDRSADGRLCGWAGVAGTTAGLEVTEALVNSAAVGQKEGARPTVAMLNPLDRARLALETEQRARYAKVYSTEGNISYSALMIETGAGSIPVISASRSSKVMRLVALSSAFRQR